MKLNRKIALWAACLIVASIAVYFGISRAVLHVIAATNLNLRPFVSEQVHYIMDEKGVEQIVNRETMARTRSGATVHYGTLTAAGHTLSGFRRIDLPDGFAALAIDSIRSKSSGYRPDARTAAYKEQLLRPPAGCLYPGEQSGGGDIVAGQEAVRVIRIAENRLMKGTFWRLPGFSCVTVQGLLEGRHSVDESWKIRGGSHLLSFAETDPAPELFGGINLYREMPPSQLGHLYMRQMGVPNAEKPFPNQEAADKAYSQAAH